jgi:hypothetical protein
MGIEEGRRPTPAMMPRRRPKIPPAQRAPARASFSVAGDIPQGGAQGAIAWPDTGVLLGLGTDRAMLARFRQHYRSGIRLTMLVCRELRAISEQPTGNVSDEDYDRITAAATAVRALLIGEGALPVTSVSQEDFIAVENVTEQLKALAETPGKHHSGEAELIVLAAREITRDQNRHIILSNDGGASIVAARHGIPTRHIGDVLAEFACADSELPAEACQQAFNTAIRVSAPPLRVHPAGIQAFTCAGTATGCPRCDKQPAAPGVG